jgi:hypothetical protein
MVAAGRVLGEGDGVNTPELLAKIRPRVLDRCGGVLFNQSVSAKSDDRQKRAALNGG